MKFFNIDLHIPVIADLEKIFNDLGHTIDINYLSNHSWVFNKKPNNSYIINQVNWKNIDKGMCNQFYNTHKDELLKYDGYIVTHIPMLSLLYEKFNKPIIFIASTRYEYPFTNDKNRWEWFNNYINNNKKIICLSNNLYDKWYCEQFTNRSFQHIPNICEYTNSKYNPLFKKILLYSKVMELNINNIVNKNSLNRYNWSDICKYSAIIHIPYNISTMSIFEQYTSNIPLFFPSKEYLLTLYKENISLTELSYTKVININNESLVKYKGIDPNNIKNESLIKLSIDLADYYNDNMPYIEYFDNIDELTYKINSCNFADISKEMSIFNIRKKEKVYDMWEKVLMSIK